MIILSSLFCGVLVVILVVSNYLRKQTVAYVKLGTLYTNKFMNCELTLEEYMKIKCDIRKNVNPLLEWYMKKRGVLND